MTGWRLVGDVGGSNVRFAQAADGALARRRSYAVSDHASFYDALRRYRDETGGGEGCHSCGIGVAGPVDDGRVKLTNAPWVIEAGEVAALLGAPCELVNDLQAVALALPFLGGEDLSPIGGAPRVPAPGRTMLAVNIGTGFGAAAAIPFRGGWVACASEPGHMTLGAADAGELALIEGFESVEHLLSGRGVVELYARLARRRGGAAEMAQSAAIFAGASADQAAAETTRHVSALLGRIAGDLVLAAGAWGGVYLCGSVAQGWAAAADPAPFRAAFERKGAMSARMRGVYSGLILREDVALFGLTHLPIAAD